MVEASLRENAGICTKSYICVILSLLGVQTIRCNFHASFNGVKQWRGFQALDYNNSKQRLPSVMDAKHIEDLVTW